MQILIILFFLAAQTTFADTAATYRIGGLIQPRNAISLLGGKTVFLKETLRPDDQVLFVDLQPSANWSHPAQIRVQHSDGTPGEKVAVTLPPERIEEAERLTPPQENAQGAPADVPPPPSLLNPPPPTFRLDDLNGRLRVKDPSRYYAVLLNGRAFLRHWNDLSFLFRVLTKIYGYSADHIFVLDSVYKEKAPDLDGDGVSDIHYGSTLSEVQAVFQKLTGLLSPSDQLLLVVNDHGLLEDGQSRLVLKDGLVSANDFAAFLKPIRASVFSVFEQCFSGAFVRPTIQKNRVSLAASTDQELSWSSPNLQFDEFLYHIISAFAFQTHDGKPLLTALDSDHDALLAREAFGYASGADRREESPLMEASPNSGFGDKISLGDLPAPKIGLNKNLFFSRMLSSF